MAESQARTLEETRTIPEQKIETLVQTKPATSAAVHASIHDKTTSQPDVDDILGTTIAGRYQILERLGFGGMADVYLARHIALEKIVAIKFIHKALSEDELVRKRFHREAVTAAALENPHIVTIHDYGIAENGRVYLVMEYLQGRDLRRLLKHEGPLSWERAIKIIKQVLIGLGAAHKQKVIHRDLKAENVFISDLDGAEFATVLDFGLTKTFWDAADTNPAIQSHLTATGCLVGTPQYIAPELAELVVDIDHRVDIYACGILLYEMVVGSRPFEGNTPLQILKKQVLEQPMRPSERNANAQIPQHLDDAIMKALHKNRDQRFSTVYEMIDSLEAGEQLYTAETRRHANESITTHVGNRSPLSAVHYVFLGMLLAVAFLLGAVLF